MTVRLLSYNIQLGGSGREDRIAAVIRESSPDIVVLQEATRPDVVERIASRSGLKTWGARRGDSLAFITRFRRAHHEWRHPPQVRRAFLELSLDEIQLRIFGVHLSAVHSNWTERRRARELQALLQTTDPYRRAFHVLVGDFNTVAPGELFDPAKLPVRLRAFVWLTGGKIRWQTVQMLLDARYVDGFRSLHPLDQGHTFPVWAPHVRLDYVFVPAAFANALERCEVLKPAAAAKASDHYPLLVELDLR